MASRRRRLDHDVVLGVAGIRSVVVDVAPKLAAELVQEVRTNARRIGTVDCDSHPAIWDILVAREEGDPLGV
jgi:hypothetical protein